MTASRVSIVIVTHNRARLLREAIDSVLAQTYARVELIVVDNGSTDDTGSVVNAYAGRVRYVKQDNLGVAAARNAGIGMSTGDYVGVLDDDDTYLPTKIERQVAILDAHPEFGLVHCRYVSTAPDGRWLEKSNISPEGAVLPELVCGCFLMVHTPLIRRQCFDDVGGFDQKIPWAADWDLWLRTAQAGYRFGGAQEVLCTYRMALGGTMMSNVARQELETMTALDRVYAAPAVPVAVLAVKDKAYAQNYLWLSSRHFGVQAWDEGWRCFSDACARLPRLRESPVNLVHIWRDDALGLRIADPLGYADGLMACLPTAFADLALYRDYLRSQILLGIALKNFADDEIGPAQAQLREAIRLDPQLPARPDAFAEMVYKLALRLAVASPLAYAETVLCNLPPEARALVAVRTRVLGDLNVGMAMENYWARQRARVPAQILTGVSRRPQWLLNRGVWAMLLKSLPARIGLAK